MFLRVEHIEDCRKPQQISNNTRYLYENTVLKDYMFTAKLSKTHH